MEAETKQSSQLEQTFDVYKWMAWMHANIKTLVSVLVAIAVVGTGIALYTWKQNSNEVEANNQLFALPIPGASEKVQRPSADSLLKIASEYPGTSAGQQAQLLAAETLFTQGKYDQSLTQFSKFLSDHPSSPLVGQASVGVAASLEAQGKTADAIQKYQDIVAHYPSVATPARLTLARLFEEQNKFDQALRNYEDLTRNGSPMDPFVAEARDRMDILLSKHPELNKPAPAAAAPATTPAPASSAPKAVAPAAKPPVAPAAAPAKAK